MTDQIVTEISRPAMATEFAIILPGESARGTEAAVDALESLETIESRLTVYQPTSEISRINQSAGKCPVAVSRDLFALIERAIQISERTDGAFDITAGPLVDCWGFTKRRGQKPTDQELADAAATVGWQHIELLPAESKVFLRKPGMKLNLGGIGKGFAIDRMAALLRTQGIDHFLIHGGKSTILAATPDNVSTVPPWKIAIEHPLRPGQRLAELEVSNGAIATSGSGKQFFHYKGQRIGHVIDPRTGRPCGDALSLTVQTETATDADAYSTACFVLGIQRTADWVQTNQRNLAAGQRVTGPTRAIAITSGAGADVRLIELGE